MPREIAKCECQGACESVVEALNRLFGDSEYPSAVTACGVVCGGGDAGQTICAPWVIRYDRGTFQELSKILL